MICDICAIIERKDELIYEDTDVVAFLSPAPRSVSEITIAPKKHVVVFGDCDDDILRKIGNVTNFLSKAVFEILGMDGTNIMIRNGIEGGQKIAHFSVDLLPRKRGDGINLEWQGIQAEPESLKETANILVSALSQSEKEKEVPELSEQDMTKYEIKRLRRLP